jgi:hypothetical protein
MGANAADVAADVISGHGVRAAKTVSTSHDTVDNGLFMKPIVEKTQIKVSFFCHGLVLCASAAERSAPSPLVASQSGALPGEAGL